MADPKSVQDQAKICLNRGKSRIKGIKDLLSEANQTVKTISVESSL